MLYTSLYVNQILLPSRQFRLHFPFKRKVRGWRNNRSLNSIVKNIEYDSKYHYSICLPLIPSQKNASLNWEINLYFVWIPCLSHHKKPKTPIIIGNDSQTCACRTPQNKTLPSVSSTPLWAQHCGDTCGDARHTQRVGHHEARRAGRPWTHSLRGLV